MTPLAWLKQRIRVGLDAYLDRKQIVSQDYLHGAFADLTERLVLLSHQIDPLSRRIGETEIALHRINESLARNQQILQATHENIESLRRLLYEARLSPDYERLWQEPHPLITVRIATYNRGRLLIERAVASVLKQTYQNFEIVIVGDHCTDETASLLEKLRDSRIRFHNLPYRGPYPSDPYHRWMVAGSPGMNLGGRLARGDWIAPLDDDDEFAADHLEKLLCIAMETKSEMVYGALRQVHRDSGKVVELWSFPPELGQFGFQGAIYLKMLQFFEYDQHSWLFDEPADWNLCRRMLEAGVRITGTPDVVTTVFFVDPKRTQHLPRES